MVVPARTFPALAGLPRSSWIGRTFCHRIPCILQVRGICRYRVLDHAGRLPQRDHWTVSLLTDSSQPERSGIVDERTSGSSGATGATTSGTETVATSRPAVAPAFTQSGARAETAHRSGAGLYGRARWCSLVAHRQTPAPHFAIRRKAADPGRFLAGSTCRTGKGDLPRERGSRPRQASSIPLAITTGFPLVARDPQALQLLVCRARLDPYCDRNNDGLLLAR